MSQSSPLTNPFQEDPDQIIFSLKDLLITVNEDIDRNLKTLTVIHDHNASLMKQKKNLKAAIYQLQQSKLVSTGHNVERASDTDIFHSF